METTRPGSLKRPRTPLPSAKSPYLSPMSVFRDASFRPQYGPNSSFELPGHTTPARCRAVGRSLALNRKMKNKNFQDRAIKELQHCFVQRTPDAKPLVSNHCCALAQQTCKNTSTANQLRLSLPESTLCGTGIPHACRLKPGSMSAYVTGGYPTEAGTEDMDWSYSPGNTTSSQLPGGKGNSACPKFWSSFSSSSSSSSSDNNDDNNGTSGDKSVIHGKEDEYYKVKPILNGKFLKYNPAKRTPDIYHGEIIVHPTDHPIMEDWKNWPIVPDSEVVKEPIKTPRLSLPSDSEQLYQKARRGVPPSRDDEFLNVFWKRAASLKVSQRRRNWLQKMEQQGQRKQAIPDVMKMELPTDTNGNRTPPGQQFHTWKNPATPCTPVGPASPASSEDSVLPPPVRPTGFAAKKYRNLRHRTQSSASPTLRQLSKDKIRQFTNPPWALPRRPTTLSHLAATNGRSNIFGFGPPFHQGYLSSYPSSQRPSVQGPTTTTSMCDLQLNPQQLPEPQKDLVWMCHGCERVVCDLPPDHREWRAAAKWCSSVGIEFPVVRHRDTVSTRKNCRRCRAYVLCCHFLEKMEQGDDSTMMDVDQDSLDGDVEMGLVTPKRSRLM